MALESAPSSDKGSIFSVGGSIFSVGGSIISVGAAQI